MAGGAFKANQPTDRNQREVANRAVNAAKVCRIEFHSTKQRDSVIFYRSSVLRSAARGAGQVVALSLKLREWSLGVR